MLGAGAYVFINDQLYLEVAGYQTLNPGALNSLGVSPIDTTPINGVAPYFRAAFEQHWGKHSWETGAFGLFTETSLPLASPGPGINRFNDVGLDSQYLYQGDGYWITVRATYIHENQQLGASVASGLAANLNNTLNTFRANSAELRHRRKDHPDRRLFQYLGQFRSAPLWRKSHTHTNGPKY